MMYNVLLEFSIKTPGAAANKVLDKMEENCKANDLFLVQWYRKGQKIRIYSKFSDIMDAIGKDKFTTSELGLIQYSRICNSDGDKLN